MIRPLEIRDKKYAVYPFNTIFGSPSHVAILRTLRRSAAGLTGREISRSSGVTRLAVMNALALLESTGLVRRQLAGRTHIFHLNREHWLVARGLFPLFAAEEEFRERARVFLRKAVAQDALAGVIFGSTARGEESSESDLDVCILVNKEKDKKKLHSRLDEVSEHLRKELGLRLSPLVFTWPEFRRGYRKRESFFENVAREGRSFHGPDLKEMLRDSPD